MRRQERERETFAASRLSNSFCKSLARSICVKFSHSGALKKNPAAIILENLQTWEHLNILWIFEQRLWPYVEYYLDLTGTKKLRKIYVVTIIFHFMCFSAQVQSTSWMPHQQYVMQPTVSTPPFTCSSCLKPSFKNLSFFSSTFSKVLGGTHLMRFIFKFVLNSLQHGQIFMLI